MAATATTATIADALGTDPRTLRKFLRSESRNVGKGSRYELPADKRSIAAMQKRFDAWTLAKATKSEETAETDNSTETAE